jgi:hypothetical protein
MGGGDDAHADVRRVGDMHHVRTMLLEQRTPPRCRQPVDAHPAARRAEEHVRIVLQRGPQRELRPAAFRIAGHDQHFMAALPQTLTEHGDVALGALSVAATKLHRDVEDFHP